MKTPKNWTFKSDDVASNFDEHVREQLPWYDLATDIVCHFVRAYTGDGGLVYDIGASTGNITKAISSSMEGRIYSIVSIDKSESMKKFYFGENELVVCDASTFKYDRFDVAVCFLTLMFMTIEERELLLNTLIEQKKKGGAIIIFDKMESPSGYVGHVSSRVSIAAKLKNGVKHKDILDKELSLIGCQRPISKEEIPAPFVDVFRYGDFAGIVIS